MELYISIGFWVGIFCFACNWVELITREVWPNVTSKSMGQHIAEMILRVGVLVWAGILIFTN